MPGLGVLAFGSFLGEESLRSGEMVHYRTYILDRQSIHLFPGASQPWPSKAFSSTGQKGAL